jgi:transcription elongation factor Elf1
MPHPEEDCEINCPYCGAGFTVRVDNTAGKRQNFVIDCENCCRPIEVEVDVDADGMANITAKREGEG